MGAYTEVIFHANWFGKFRLGFLLEVILDLVNNVI
jgi:hypothetical protein